MIQREHCWQRVTPAQRSLLAPGNHYCFLQTMDAVFGNQTAAEKKSWWWKFGKGSDWPHPILPHAPPTLKWWCTVCTQRVRAVKTGFTSLSAQLILSSLRCLPLRHLARAVSGFRYVCVSVCLSNFLLLSTALIIAAVLLLSRTASTCASTTTRIFFNV